MDLLRLLSALILLALLCLKGLIGKSLVLLIILFVLSLEEVGEEREVPRELTDQELCKNFPFIDAISAELFAGSFAHTALVPVPLILSSDDPLLNGDIILIEEEVLEDMDNEKTMQCDVNCTAAERLYHTALDTD